MTHDEAMRVRRVALTADGGCSSCGYCLMLELAAEFPDHLDVWLTGYDDERDQDEIRAAAHEGVVA